MAYLGVKPAAITSATEAEIAGDLTVDTNTLAVNSANDKVGMGTTSGSGQVTIEGAGSTRQLVITDDDVERLQLYHIGDNSTIESSSSGSNSTNLIFKTSSSGTEAERFRIKNDGDISIADGNLILASGHGIDFSATGSGDDSTGQTVQAELLNDYEHGLWTPTVNGDTTYHHQYGMYQKIGRQVTAWFRLKINAANTPGASFYMDGLPYNNDHNGNLGGNGTVFYFSSIGTSTTMMTCRVDGGGSTINFTGNVGSGTSANAVNISWVANNAEVQGSITYMTDYT